jgi:steroid 5-alpha reductase family enzyme
MATGGVLAAAAAWTALAMGLLWLLSLRLRDASIVDVYWGPGFAALAAIGFLATGGGHPRRALVLALAVLWGLRLGGHLLWRNAGRGEDYRYRAMRRRHGERFGVVSLFSVFGLQAILQWTVALPLLLTQAAPGPARLGALDALGVGLWCAGMLFETLGDLQLARFRADPASQGQVLDRGLWRYTRHPNYFGDFLVWWGFGAIALAAPHGGIALIGPALMSFLLLRVSGVALLERTIAERRPAYREYQQRTNAFFPGPPRRHSSAAEGERR